MRRALVTGGSGFFGGILKRRLLKEGWRVVNLDLVEDDDPYHENLKRICGNIAEPRVMDRVLADDPVDVVFHCAAILAHDVKDKNWLWRSNVDGTRMVADAMEKHGVKQIVFTSSNCLWGEPLGRPIKEDDPVHPVEIYGKSKLEGENILLGRKNLNAAIIRCPTILEAGRLGLLAILYEFIDDDKKVWVVGGGRNRYQFIDANDLATACIKAADLPKTEIFGIGSDHVKTFKEVYEYVIKKAGSKSRVKSLPKGPTLLAMRVAHMLGLSPLGPYQYKMIAESCEFDTTKIKKALDWKPTVTNEEMLWKAYEYYRKHREEIAGRTKASAHKRAAKMGVIRLLKWLS